MIDLNGRERVTECREAQDEMRCQISWRKTKKCHCPSSKEVRRSGVVNLEFMSGLLLALYITPGKIPRVNPRGLYLHVRCSEFGWRLRRSTRKSCRHQFCRSAPISRWLPQRFQPKHPAEQFPA